VNGTKSGVEIGLLRITSQWLSFANIENEHHIPLLIILYENHPEGAKITTGTT